MPEQTTIVGVKGIAKFYGFSVSRTKQLLPHMKEIGIVKRLKVGRGHARGIRLMALPSLLERYWVEYLKNA